MAHGQDARPIESVSGAPVVVTSDNTLSITDRSVAAILEELLGETRKVRMALEILIEQEITDEV